MKGKKRRNRMIDAVASSMIDYTAWLELETQKLAIRDDDGVIDLDNLRKCFAAQFAEMSQITPILCQAAGWTVEETQNAIQAAQDERVAQLMREGRHYDS